MRDREMVAAIVAGDPAGLAAAYERYAPGLHAYCCSLLTEPADADTAVRDTFTAATTSLAYLREHDRLRAWLYAVARNACHRRLRDRAAAGLAGLGGASADPAGAATADRRSEPRELAAAAIAALTAAERDIVELSLCHDLDEAGIAAVFLLSRHQGHVLVSRARRRFEASLSALLVARAGPEFCPGLSDLLAGWDGQLTDVLRKRLGRHIGRCPVCGERKRRKLQAAMLLGLRPVPALADSVWRLVIKLVADTTADGAAKRAHITQRAEPFGKSGFPVPLDPPALPRPPGRSMAAAVVGVAALATAGTGIVAVTQVPHYGGQAHDSPGSVPGVQGNKPTVAPQASAAPGPTAPRSGPTVPSAVPIGKTGTGPGPAATGTAPGLTTMPPTYSGSAPPVAAGVLTASPTTVVLARPGKGLPPTGSFTLTANGGPVMAFTVTIPAAYAADLTVTPVTGALAAGQTVQVTVTLRKGYRGQLQSQLTVDPGGLAVTVVYRPSSGGSQISGSGQISGDG
jgi:RNA polymerase sigma factor (sigma-70 family)